VSSCDKPIASDLDALYCKLSRGLYVESSGRCFSSNPMDSGRGPVVTGLSAVFSSVQAVFFVIFRSLAAERAPFFSYIVAGFGLRSDLRNCIAGCVGIVVFIKNRKKVAKDLYFLAR
jgi:hypothetical protein